MATSKSTKTSADKIEETKETKVAETAKPVVRKFNAEDLIPVRSVTQGELLLPGKKTGILYRWAAFGDITEVEYQDLYSLKSSRSPYVYSPLFVVEDEDLLADPKWKDVVLIYEKMYDAQDFNEILKLPIQKFKSVLKQLPEGYKNALKIEVSTRLDRGTFDSIAKIKAVDEICGTDFMNLLG